MTKPLASLCLLAAWLWLATLAVSAEPEPLPSSRAAIRQYRTAVAFQNRAIYDLAVAEWNKFLDDHAQDPLVAKAQHYLGICHFQMEKYPEAQLAFEASLKQDPDSPLSESNYLNLGLSQLNQGLAGDAPSLRDAAATLDQQLAKFPQGKHAPAAIFYRAEALYSAGDKQRAIESYQQLVDEFPDDILRAKALYGLGVSRQELGDLQAAAAFDLFLERYPEDPMVVEVRMRRGELLLADGQPAEAEKYFAAAANANDFPLADYALMQQALCQYKRDQFQPSAERYAELVSRFPKSEYVDAAQLAAGKCYLLANQPQNARKWLDKARKQPGRLGEEAIHWWAQCRLKEEQPQEALEAVERAIAEAPQSPFLIDWKMDRAHALYAIPARRRDSVAAFAEVVRLDARHAESARAAYMSAYAALGTRQFDEALRYVQVYRQAYSESPFTADVTFVAAESHLQKEQYPQATVEYQKVLDQSPGGPWTPHALLGLGTCQLNMRQYAEAEATVTELIRDHADSEPAQRGYFVRASARQRNGNATAAIDDIQTLLNLDAAAPQRSNALLIRGLCEASLKQYEKAEATFVEILEKEPGYAAADQVLYELAWAYVDQEKSEKGVATFVQLAEKYPQSPLAAESLYRVGEAQYENGQYAESVQSYRRAIDADDDGPLAEKALHKLGWAHFQRQAFDQAIEAFADQRKRFPDGPLAADSLAMQAESLYSQKQYDPALALFQQAVEKKLSSDPLLLTCLLHAAQAASQLEKWPESQALLEKAEQKFPGSEYTDEIAFELAWAKHKLGLRDEALATFAAVADRNPHELGARSRFMTGEIQFEQKKYEEAVRSFFKVAYGFGDKDAPVAYHVWQSNSMFEAARCLELLKKPVSARRVYAELIERFPNSDKVADARAKLRGL